MFEEGDVIEECPKCRATGVIEEDFEVYICARCEGACYIKHECDDCERDTREYI